jgi:hypothetical protein
MNESTSPEEIKFLELLKDVQETLARTVDSLDINLIPKWEVRYLLWACVFINQASRGYLSLRNEDNAFAAKLLIRPILEVFLSTQAVLSKRGFLFRKIYTELAEFKKSDPNATAADFDKMVDNYVKAFHDHDKTYPCERKKVDMSYTAQVANMVDHYEVVYRIYCKYTHGAQIAVTGALNSVTDDVDTGIVVELLLRTLGHLQKEARAKIPELDDFHKRYKSCMPKK